MKTTSILYTALAAIMLAAMPVNFAAAEETADSTTTHKRIVYDKNNKVNGRAITPQEKEVAKKMAKQGAQMGSKAAKLALTAITNPSKADSLGKELEKMGDEMERLGDSLESLSEDTTFLYEGEDSDTVVLSDEDFDDIAEEFGKNWDFDFKMPGLLGGILGIFGGILGIFIAIFVVLLLFAIFTSPLWVIALIIWLAVRSSRKNNASPYVTQTTSTGQPLNASQSAAAGQAASAQSAQPQTAAPLATNPKNLSDENQEMWKSGIMVTCVGIGLIVLFLSVGFESFWGIGALVACIGVAKLIIATTTKNKSKNGGNATTTTDVTADDNYEK